MAAPQSRESASKNTHAVVFEMLREALNGGVVLDIPCGSGAFTKRLLDAGYEVIAADIASHPAVPDEQFMQADMNKPLPLENESVDAIVSIEGIEHIERPFDFVRECRRVLKEGQPFYLTTPNISSLRSRWRWFLTGFHNKAKIPLDETDPQPRHHINMLSYPQLRYMLHTNGFKIEEIRTNRVKLQSRLYAPWAVVQRVVTKLAFTKGVKSVAHAEVVAQVREHMGATPLLFGETLALAARAVSTTD